MVTQAINILAQLDACWEMGRTGRSTEALVEAQRLLLAARRASDNRAIAMALTCNAWSCLQLGYADEGLDSAIEARQIFHSLQMDWGQALSGAVYSWLLLELGLSDLGFEAASEALVVAERTDDLALKSFAMSCRGMALLLCRQDQMAFPMLETALELAEAAADDCTIALNLINMGYSMGSQAELAIAGGDQDRARRMWERGTMFTDRAITIARQYGDLWNLRGALCNAAEFQAFLGEMDRAQGYLDEWAALPGRVGPREQVHYLDTKGQVLTSRGNYRDALAVCRETVRQTSNVSSADLKVQALRRLSAVEAELGEFRMALEHYQAFHAAHVRQLGDLTQRRAHVMEMQLQNERLRARAAQLEIEVSQDVLTGIANRRAFEQAFGGLTGLAFCLALVDVDRFKLVNDRFSHVVGDAVLQRVARLLSAQEGVSVYRIGGEEFALLFVGLDLQESARLAEFLRERLEQSEWSDLARGLVVTASMGLVEGTGRSLKEVLTEADHRLYRAKDAGRNCVISTAPPKTRLAIHSVG